MIHRFATTAIERALTDTPVVLLNGPRQSGKSTLVRWLARERMPAAYLTFDDAATRAAAERDPVGFIAAQSPPVVVDEVQLVPELFRVIKAAVDRKRKPGQFLLTGSANVLLLPKIAESLAGRIEIINLHPFSAGEIEGRRERFVDAMFDPHSALPARGESEHPRILERAIAGGYPEVLARTGAARRRAWFGSYVTTVLQKDVREMANIDGLTQMPRLLGLLATQSANLLNVANLSRDTGISQPTLKRYLTLLEATFLFQPLAPYSGNLGKRLTRTPKAFLNDTGLMAYLLGLEAGALASELAAGIGPLLESFVLQELRRQIAWSEVQPAVFFYRTAAGREVDIVLEDRRRRVVGIEVKASATVRADAFRGLEDLAEGLGNRFLRGIVLYTGHEPIRFGARLLALPIAALWSAFPEKSSPARGAARNR